MLRKVMSAPVRSLVLNYRLHGLVRGFRLYCLTSKELSWRGSSLIFVLFVVSVTIISH